MPGILHCSLRPTLLHLLDLAALHRDLPLHVVTRDVLGRAGVARIGMHDFHFAVQQLVDHYNFGGVRRRGDYRMHEARIGINANVRLHSEVPLLAVARLMHFRIAFTRFVLGRAGRCNDRRVDDAAALKQQALARQAGIDSRQNVQRQIISLQQSTEVEDRRLIRDRPIERLTGESRVGVISYSASSIAGSLKPNQFCIGCTRSMVGSGYGRRPPAAIG